MAVGSGYSVILLIESAGFRPICLIILAQSALFIMTSWEIMRLQFLVTRIFSGTRGFL